MFALMIQDAENNRYLVASPKGLVVVQVSAELALARLEDYYRMAFELDGSSAMRVVHHQSYFKPCAVPVPNYPEGIRELVEDPSNLCYITAACGTLFGYKLKGVEGVRLWNLHLSPKLKNYRINK